MTEATFYSSWIHLVRDAGCSRSGELVFAAIITASVALYRSFNAVDAYSPLKCSSCESSTISIAT